MDNRIQISDNFTLYDVQYNEQAVRLGINNDISSDALADNARALALGILEPLIAAGFQYYITSWYRSEALEKDYSRNAYVQWCIANRLHIRPESWRTYLEQKQHQSCCAVTLRSRNNSGLFEFIQTLPAFDTLQNKTHWISVSLTKNNQKRVIHE